MQGLKFTYLITPYAMERLSVKTYPFTFQQPFGLCIDKEGVLYVADSGNHCIRKIGPDEKMTLVAGSGEAGHEDGQGAQARFNTPTGLCVDTVGNIWVADFRNHCIRKVDPSGKVTTLAGSGQSGYWDGDGRVAKFNYPRGIVINSKGMLLVSDSWNHRIRQIDQSGRVSTFAGGGPVTDRQNNEENRSTHKDGSGFGVRLGTVCGLSIDDQDRLYVADASNHRIRKISPEGIVTTLAGNGLQGMASGSALDTRLNNPTEVCLNEKGELFFSDTHNDTIRKLDSKGHIQSFGKAGDYELVDESRETVYLNYPRGLAVGKKGMLFFLDSNNNCLRGIEMK